MNASASWYNAERVAQKGSVILSAWKAEREAARAVRNATYPSSSGTQGSQLYEWLTGGALSSAGPAVTERTAMSIGAVYACVGLIGGAIASLPLPIYQRTADGREKTDHDLWWLLNEQPSVALSAAVFWEYLTWSLLLHGDAFAVIRRVSRMSPKVQAFEPVHPLAVTVQKVDGRLVYTLLSSGKTEVFDQDDMLHVPGLGFDGLRGLSPLRYAARQSVGIALAADEYSARFFSNGARPDYVVTVNGKLGEEQAKVFRESWMARYAGLNNAHIPAILSGPEADVKALSLNAKDAQLIETRNYQAGDIARLYGVPPHMIGLTDKSTSWGAGIEQQSIGFVKYTLQRHLVKFEQEINRKCFRTSRHFAEFATAGLERGDYKARNEGYRIAAGRAGEPGWMTINEIRKLENLPPIEGGNELNKGTTTTGVKPNEPATQAAG